MGWLRDGFFSLFCTILIGALAGGAGVAFEYFSNMIFHYGLEVSSTYFSFFQFAFISLFLISGGALLAGGLMVSYAPDAPGSGIPQVRLAYSEGKFDFTWKLVWVKFVGGIFSIGTGSSLGREGPTIHIGAALASKVAKGVGEPEGARANAICAGAAAGLAAAFNSPLAGMTLVLEEVAESRNMDKYAGRCLLASAVAVTIIYFFKGNVAALPIQGNIVMQWGVVWMAPLISLFSCFVGVFFQWATLRLQQRFRHSALPAWLRPASGALAAGVICLIAYKMTGKLGSFGLGEHDLKEMLGSDQIVWTAALWLLGTKVFATIICYGSGGCGGIFAPLIFFGAMSGAVVFGIADNWLELNREDQILFSLIGMTACLSSVVRAPLTSILIVFEMTRQLYVLPALMIAAVIGAFANTLFFADNFYGASIIQKKVKID